ncbi:uncharacterized protein LOC105222349 isoform X1 [Bactrocera dorsalis]|uniref:Uncharacterized protein LOC105222349 isoform X1 n=2 Tax=Bactrocera dorsalis TaxID=27457 RepID=A0A6I9ULL2_BACDO|nr:uncharacterized protein LOC105222349 isoform X1 [Bactrocera dorsalis]XP_011197936.2 uncharacterized protein LOC105222349 isoform X1 [Bactrocera dorsalis]
MALTVVKYRKPGSSETTASGAPTPAILIKSKLQPQQQQQIAKKPILKLEAGSNLIINKIPATIKPAIMKRSNTSSIEPPFKSTKYSLQTIASAGTPLTSFQWQQTIGGPGGTTITTTPTKKQQIGATISSLPPSTIIQASGVASSSSINGGIGTTITPTGNTFNAVTSQGTTLQVRRPTIVIKREFPKRSIRSVALELIEKNPYVHLGVLANRLPLLKNIICTTANITTTDCYLTLKKMRQNEEFSLLAEYFELSETEVQQIFARTVVKLARYLRLFVRWPESKKYYDRHKNLPFAFRSTLSHVQSLIECVETDMPRLMPNDCSNYKFIFSITPTGIISYISEAFVGHHDDLTIFNASDFQNSIPKYLSLVADPGKAIRRKRKPKHPSISNSLPSSGNAETDSTTDSADESADDIEVDDSEDSQTLSRYAASRVAAELASHQTMNIVNSELTSRKVKDFTIPTMRVREPVCRQQIRHMINCLRDFKMLQPYAIQEPIIFQYLNEILIVASALTNMQR